uniref:Uncharacterized protein n=1 Tax=Avena sativa TaxID=4498 RepID=A0ACD5UEQ1_AVESA
MLFDGDKAQSVLQACDIRPLPLTVHRPTLKEAKRVYSNLTQLYYGTECSIMAEVLPHVENGTNFEQSTEAKEEIIVPPKEPMLDSLNSHEAMTVPLSNTATTPLHEAAKAGNIEQTLELLEQGLDPCIKDERGKTPYLLASDKEVRNTFRRFMALNLDKWDWHAADVPSALTKEMEESQAAKQAEKDAKKKARAKELKKQKKAREKEKEKEKALASQSQPDVKGTSAGQMAKATASAPGLKLKHPQAVALSMQEERERKMAKEREKRAAAAERRFAALAVQSGSTSGASAAAGSSSTQTTAAASDATCSCCFSSLAGKVPFHRYSYKYCSTTCTHLHTEMLEDD